MVSSNRSMVVHERIALLLSLTMLADPAGANHFRGREIAADSPTASPILEELERVLGTERRVATESRVQRLEEILRPTFQAMPKDSDGGLRPDAVRYTLHRLFVDRHGWYVKGLEPGGEAWNATSPAAMFELHAEDDVHALFQDRLSSHSFDLHHVAVLAATLESFVHAETVERLHAAYNLTGIARHEDDSTEDNVTAVMDTYMMLYVLGRNHSSVTFEMMEKYRKVVHKVYPTWDATRAWVREVRAEVTSVQGGAPSTSFLSTTKTLEEVADRYGRWQDRECQDLKAKLVKLELKGTGRVPLDAFYGSALEGNWQFSESAAYLRQLGVLDETDASRPSIMIPNYINSPSNCVASSKFYEVCCINECEALFGNLELRIAKPEASPERISELIMDLPSASVTAPKELPKQLLERLDEIANENGGMVPLHSRLFAQWMHHVYPRECPFPHISGTTKPLSAKEWRQATGEKATVDRETMEWHVEEARNRAPRHASDTEASLPWSSEDERFVCTSAPSESGQESYQLRPIFKNIIVIAAMLSVTVGLVRSTFSAVKSVGAIPQQKYMV